MKCLCSLALMFLPVLSIGQTSNPHYELPPAPPPASCAFALAGVDSLTGPVASKRLAIQLKALQSGQEAVLALAVGMKGLNSESNPALAMSSVLTGTKQAHDALMCSASLIAKYKPIDDADNNARTLLIVAYNQGAAAIEDLEAHLKEQFIRKAGERTQEVLLKDAERVTALTSLQNEAATTLAEVTSFSLLSSSDMDNSDTKSTVLPCKQYKELKKGATALSKESESAYTIAASLFVTFLSSHACKMGETAALDPSKSDAPSLNSQSPNFDSRFPWYVDVIRRKTAQYWYKQDVDPGTPDGSRVFLSFSVSRSGEPSEVRIAQSSGSLTLDTSCVRAVQRVDTYGPLPSGYDGLSLQVSYYCEQAKR